jgi:predicted ATPase
MPVRFVSNNLQHQAVKAAVEQAVLDAIGAPSGDWLVWIQRDQQPSALHIKIQGPKFEWSVEYLVEERFPRDFYQVIRRQIVDAVSSARVVVYLSYAYPDNADGFVEQLCHLLCGEFQVQTGLPTEGIWDISRALQEADWSTATAKFVERATILVPVISPKYFSSAACRKEFEEFLEREKRTGRRLIFPVYILTAAVFDDPAPDPFTWSQLFERHNPIDLRLHRLELTSTQALRAIVSLASSIRDSLLPPPAPEASREPLYVKSLRLENFRCFDQLTLRFDRPSSLDGRWTCIAGINGSGKSSILQALAVALLGNPLAIELGGERLNRMRRADAPPGMTEVEVELKAEESDQLHRFNLRISEPMPGPQLAAYDWNEIRQLVVAGYGATRNLTARADSDNETLSPDVRRQITLFDPLRRLAGADAIVGRQQVTNTFTAVFQKVIQEVFGAELQIDQGSLATSPLSFVVANKDHVEAIDLPDGFRSTAAWLADLCSVWCEKEPDLAAKADLAQIHAIVLIDEIDLHLHPSLQRSLIPRLRKTLPKVQWIVTTHSPLVLANFDVNEIIALDRDQDGNIRELDRQILGFTADEIYEWLMGTRPMGAAMEEELRKSDAGAGKSPEEIARLMRQSPKTNEEAAGKQVTEFGQILKSLNL